MDQPNHDFVDSMLAFDNDTSMDHYFSGIDMNLPAMDAFEQSIPMFSNQPPRGFTPRGLAAGFTPNTVAPGVIWNSDQLNGFPFPSQAAPQTTHMQTDPNGVAFDGLLMLSDRMEEYPSEESKSETRTPTPKESEDSPAPKAKRGRKKGKRKQLSQEEQEAKRNKFLERNRQAATKCRMKKKQWTQSLDDRMRQLQLMNAQLRRNVDEILHEKSQLLQLLSSHTQCHDQEIQDYYGRQGVVAETAVGNAHQNGSIHVFPNLADPMIQLSNRDLRAMKRQDSAVSYQSQSDTSEQNSIEMSRQGSSASTGSLVRDSGISNMGTPDKPKCESSPVSDEGFSTDGFSASYMPNPRTKVGAAGPLNLLDPEIYLLQQGKRAASPSSMIAPQRAKAQDFLNKGRLTSVR
jgi:hypothetical protein